MTLCNLLLDTCVAIKRLQEDQDGCKVRDFLIDKKQFLSAYSITEFKKTFIVAVKFLDSMIDEGRSITDIYHDTTDMKISSDSKLSKLGTRLEMLLVLLGNPKKIDEQMLYHLKMWRQGLLTFQFIGSLTLINSRTGCSMSKRFPGEFLDNYSNGDICDIQRFFSDYNSEITLIEKSLRTLSDPSFNDMQEVLKNKMSDFNCLKCTKIGDIIIAIDFLDYFFGKSDSALCSTDHHFDILCQLLKINRVNPLTKDIYIST